MKDPVRADAGARLPDLAPDEALETIRAIRGGEVDGFVVTEAESERVYLLETALRPYHDLVERMGQGAAVLARNGDVVFANRRLAAMVGCAPEALVGTHLPELLEPSTQTRCDELLAGVDAGGATLEIELLRADGTGLPAVLSLSALPDAVTLCAVVTDLTEQQARERLERELGERRRAEAALRESEARFRAMAETIPGILFSCDAQGRPEYVNSRFEEYTGVVAGPDGPRWTDVLHPDDTDASRARWERALADGQPFETRCRMRWADGRYRWLQVRARPMRDEHGAVVQWFGVCTDIDDLVRAEQALVDADRHKDRFLVTLAHELRNPLAPISDAMTYLDRVGATSPDAVVAREVSKRQVAHLGRVIDDLLDLSRIRRGSVWLRTELCDLAELVRATAEDHRRVLENNGLELVVAVPSAPVWVEVDRTRVSQVLRNLLHNANKFTERGGRVSVTLKVEPEEVVLTVRDTGVGIPAALLDKVFKPFEQGGRAVAEGLGLGLSLVRGLVELHGGSVVAESDGPGAGSAFVVRLPWRDDGLLPREDTPTADEPPRTSRRVLLVEDDADTRMILQALLTFDGHQVEVRATGEAAIACASEWSPEVVLCDIGLRGRMNGYDVARALRVLPDLDDTLLIALTGYGHEEDQRRALAAGFDHHLVKPADYDSLSELLEAKRSSR